MRLRLSTYMKLVDSSAWVEFFRRKGDPGIKRIVASLVQSDQAAFTCPIRFELLTGARPGEEADLERVFALSQHFPFEQDDWREAARLERHFRGRGVHIPRNDLFVATIALRADLPIICRDAHFSAAQKIVGEKLKVEQV
jgi:predicted nucleic acid-binding protein